MGVVLRPHQRSILNEPEIKAILRYLSKESETYPESRAPLLVAPTGAGKTTMASAVSRYCYDRSLRVLILVPRREILRQWVRALTEAGLPSVGCISPDHPLTGDLIQVGMTQSVVNRLARLKRPDLIIPDEAHHDKNTTKLNAVLSYFGSFLLGLTATPWRLDGTGLGIHAAGSFTKIIDTFTIEGRRQKMTLRYLVDEGFLAMPVLFRPPEEVADQFHITRGDYDTKEQQEVMARGTVVGNVIAHYREHLDGAPTICACVSIEHAKLMADQFQQAGYRARAVWGDMDDKDRDDALGGLATGAVQIITFCDLIDEGVDIPTVMGVILLRRSRSLRWFLQVIGRGLRTVYAKGYSLDTKEGRLAAQMEGPKPKAIILDHAGNYNIHGHPLADREWTLETVKRKLSEKPPATTTCPKCYGVWPGRPRACPNPACGHSFDGAERERKRTEFVELEGRLVEAGIDSEEADSMAGFLQRALSADAKTRRKMLLAKSFELAMNDQPEEVKKRKIEELAKAAGYSKDWITWAWKFMEKARR